MFVAQTRNEFKQIGLCYAHRLLTKTNRIVFHSRFGGRERNMCRQGVLGSGSGAGQNRDNRAVTVTKRIRNHDYGPDATLATCAIRFEVCIKDISTIDSVFHKISPCK